MPGIALGWRRVLMVMGFVVGWASALVPGSCEAAERFELAPDYMVRNWQTEDGLPQNTVQTILQTQDGYLWLGTYNGLVRFDGVHFTTFNLGNAPEMGSDSVVCLLEDARGRLWAGTDGRGLTCYSGGQFTNYFVSHPAGASVVSALAQDSAGQLWVATDGGLFRWVSGRLEAYESAAEPEGFGIVRALCCDRAGRLWVAAERGLYVIAGNEVRRIPGYEGITRLSIAADGSLWCYNVGAGLGHCQPNQPAPGESVKAVRFDSCPLGFRVCANGDLWFCGEDLLARVRDGHVVRYTLPQRGRSVMSVYEDREGNIWVGVNGGGLLRLREIAVQTLSTREGLPGNDIVTLFEESPGRVWIGGFDLGVGIWEAGRFSAVPGLPFGRESVLSLARDIEGRIWVGTREGVLQAWAGGKVVHTEAAPRELARVLFSSAAGDLWLGSRLDGVEHRRRQDGLRARYTPTNGLSDSWVTAIAEDREGAIWVGTKHGLNRIHAGRVTSFYREQGLGADRVHALYVDRAGVLWVGTVGGGLAVAQGGRFEAIGTRQGLANDVIAQIVEDGSGAFWLGSNNGLMRIHRSELLACARGAATSVHCRTWGRNEGMLDCECAGGFQPACFQAHDGRLWFATVGGAVIVDTRRLATNNLVPPVRVESVLADGGLCPLSLAGEQPACVVIPAGTRRIQVDYTGLGFVAPESVNFQVRLDPVDATWVNVGTRRVAYFHRLPPGEYWFHVRACNNDGVWNEVGTKLRLEVGALWWQSGTFRWSATLGAVVLGALGGWAIHRRRLHRALELAERRSAELRNAELGAANQVLQSRTKELETALANVKTLRGMIPICAGCKKIRDDQGYWEQVEMYVSKHSDAKFSHGLCPACAKKYFPGFQPSSASSPREG